tara:strand:+ start:1992 stop:2498 length:507 start_codon:yes stop_codon:yes gene_type:complete
MKYTAKNIIKDKFWIVLNNGEKLGTVKYAEGNYEFFENGAKQTHVYTEEEFKEHFKVINTDNSKGSFVDVFGYNTNCEEVFNVRTEENVPVFTKTVNSKNFHCAGYYAIYFPSIKWSSAFCPRLKTLKSYPFMGPFKTESDVNLAMKRKRYEQNIEEVNSNMCSSTNM